MDNITTISPPYHSDKDNYKQVTIVYNKNNNDVTIDQIELLEHIILTRFSSLIESKLTKMSTDCAHAHISMLIHDIHRWHSVHINRIGKHMYRTNLFMSVQSDYLMIQYINNMKGFDLQLKLTINRSNGFVDYSYNGMTIASPFDYITKCIEVFDRKIQKRYKISFNRMKLHCPICEKCSKYVYSCGHFICGACLEELEIRDNFKCPSCNTKQKVIELFPNKA